MIMFANDVLKGKKILVTGGGTGLGQSFTRRFVELGAEIVICGRRKEVLEDAVRQLQEVGGKAAFFVCDVRSSEAVERMFDEIWKDGPLDGLVNNAAGNFIARTEQLSAKAFDSVLNIVLHGTAYCSLAAGRRWIAADNKGTILSIITSAAWLGRPFTVPSAAAKAGVLALMQSLAMEWGPKGIRTVAVSPGLFPTPGAWERLYPDKALADAQIKQVPLRRLGEHVELANLVSYLMSDFASYINGDCINMDGGISLQQGGGGSMAHLYDWTPAQWDEYRAKPLSK
jgi:NAD(P)-dependent dehydrogenase (short-subunit alcohol dehydrogenase family)